MGSMASRHEALSGRVRMQRFARAGKAGIVEEGSVQFAVFEEDGADIEEATLGSTA